ncbi:MFS transporter [Prauserella cavernicola]|uniref:MFS transporter n=1 Tax=Prauserella cavernicola TaxID=2800127 RepID=A0A934QQP4_9PSEU|nr:MFS transporter [Prauserella cavernicola]MBK1783659.1 MFS transporter [Prauserella cavernicola]
MAEQPDTRPVIRSPQDVNDLINSGRAKGGKSGAITFIALGGIFIDAYDFSSIAFGLKDITESFQLTAFQEGAVAASIMIGALLGALVGGYLVDRLGRYKLFMADMLFFVVAAIACAVAPNFETLTGARLLMGIGIGIDFPVALAFIAEFNALRGKGSKVSLWQPMWYLATGSAFLVLLPLYFLIPDDGHEHLWRWAVGFGAVPALVVMLVRHKYMDESPSWAASQGDLHRAAGILHRSYGIEVRVEQPPEQTVKERRGAGDIIAEFARLFSPRYRARTILAATVSFCQSIQYYAVGFALPVIISGFLHQDRLTSILGPLVFNLVFGVLGGLLGVRLANRLGSWKLSASGFAICLAALTGLGLLGSPEGTWPLALSGLLLGAFVFFHSYGPGAQGMTMATLSYPTSLRGVGGGFGQAVLRIGSMLSLLWFPTLSASLGTGVYFVVAVAPVLGLIVLALIRWEPVGVDVDAEEAADQAAASTQNHLIGKEK